MIVATRFWRNSIVCISFLSYYAHVVQATIIDNRYIPWNDTLYTGGDSRDFHIDGHAFFLTGNQAYRVQARSIKDEQIVSYPELWGELDLAKVANAVRKAGMGEVLPDDWVWLSEIKAKMPSSLEGQGVQLSGYFPIVSHFGIGASAALLKLSTFVSVVPDQSTIDKLNLTAPGNQALFQQTLQTIYQRIGIKGTTDQQVGVGDIELYLSLHDVHEYKYKFRKLDWGVHAGVVIPAGLKYNPHNLASIPFGGLYGSWAWYIAPRAEFQLRDDLKFGARARLQQRFDNCFYGRIPVDKEQVLFAPYVGNVSVDHGTTFGASIYFVFEEIRAGLGAQIQYTVNYHENDHFNAKTLPSGLEPKFNDPSYFSTWSQEYCMFKLFYDIGHDKFWKIKPMAYFSWDIPMNHLFGYGFAQTHKIAIGCNINF